MYIFPSHLTIHFLSDSEVISYREWSSDDNPLWWMLLMTKNLSNIPVLPGIWWILLVWLRTVLPFHYQHTRSFRKCFSYWKSCPILEKLLYVCSVKSCSIPYIIWKRKKIQYCRIEYIVAITNPLYMVILMYNCYCMCKKSTQFVLCT